ncbi:hypothetical protein JCM30237_22570 [Halolamina litorea]|uniref:DUF7967 domain-containing protein n=1 Tax=Halolamina litorea TaxID=1515593 RepID=A0ABD6BSL9_9EURY|nr:hypothetical protein [Halolamina litorea]
MPASDDDTVRVWLVERTYSDDEQNIVILVYATPDGERYLRKERALTSFGDRRDTTAGIDADPGNLGETDDEDRDRYAEEAQRMAAEHDPEDTI